MARWFRRKARSADDLRRARTWMIVNAIFWLGWTALHASESPELRFHISDWMAMSLSAACAVGAAYYQNRLDRTRALEGYSGGKHPELDH
ncbi:hypothetical protein AB0N24_26655 [Arthrobacter sp. NPDC093128]|uniref:hypothetical protein n=1 Tax=Arthrobacter sp. NPDC093128 TaxID=3154979 RepID=UPI0034421C73